MKFLIISALLLVFPVIAQETTAGGTMETQASWTALQNMLNATNGNVTILRTDVNAIKACGAQKKIWTGTACVNAAVTIPSVDTSLYDKMVACGDRGLIYDKSAGTCVRAIANAPSCSLTPQTVSTVCGQGFNAPACPSGYTSVSTSSRSCSSHGDKEAHSRFCLRVTCS